MPTNEAGRALNQQMVDALKKREGLLDKAAEAAFRAVPRHVFMPGEALDKVYQDEALAIKRDTDGTVLSSSSQPSMMAIMLRQLRLDRGDNVLEIGTGTGYNAAIMQHIVGDRGFVTSIELDQQLADQARRSLQLMNIGTNVNVVVADGAGGYAPRASYDRIICTAAAWDIPPAWIKQLKPDGVLVAPLWVEGMQFSAAFTLQADGTLYSPRNLPCMFIPMRGAAAGAVATRRISSSALSVSARDMARIDSVALGALLNDPAEINRLDFTLDVPEYWTGFVPYLMLNAPDNYEFLLWYVPDNQQAYGMDGSGFALFRRGTACFVPYNGEGVAFAFGGADGFMAMQALLHRWSDAKRPGVSDLRLQILPKDRPHPSTGPSTRLYERQYNNLLAWLDLN